METAQQIQDFAHECLIMLQVIRDDQPFTDMEFRVIQTYLHMLALELALKQSSQLHVSRAAIAPA